MPASQPLEESDRARDSLRLHPARAWPFNPSMPRKPALPTIPDKPTGRTKPERSRVDPKHRPDPSPEQFDLWGGFAASWEQGEAVEAAPPRQSQDSPTSDPTHRVRRCIP
jgi:hypothetical protein